MKFSPTWWQRTAETLLLLLVTAVPLGTRLIVAPGSVAGRAAEWGTFSLYGTQLLAASFCLAVLLSRPKRPVRALTLAAPLAAAVVVSALASGHLAKAAATAWWLLLGLAVWVAVVALRPSAETFARALAAAGLFQAILGLWQFMSQTVAAEKWLGVAAQLPSTAGVAVLESGGGRWLRAYGTMSHPNIYGFFVTVGLLAAVYLAMGERKVRRRRWALLTVGVLALGLLFSYSRAAWLAASVGLVTLALARGWSGKDAPNWHRTAAPLAVIAAIFLTAVVAEPGLIAARLTAAGRLEQMSVEQRVSSLRDGRTLLLDSPLTGAGPGLAMARLAELEPQRAWWRFEPPHFLPLAVAVETGLLGLLTWAFNVAVIGRYTLTRALKAKARSPAQALMLAALMAMAVAACFDHFLWTTWPGYLLGWLVMGMAAVTAANDEN
jgi:O-antigen ligase